VPKGKEVLLLDKSESRIYAHSRHLGHVGTHHSLIEFSGKGISKKNPSPRLSSNQTAKLEENTEIFRKELIRTKEKPSKKGAYEGQEEKHNPCRRPKSITRLDAYTIDDDRGRRVGPEVSKEESWRRSRRFLKSVVECTSPWGGTEHRKF